LKFQVTINKLQTIPNTKITIPKPTRLICNFGIRY